MDLECGKKLPETNMAPEIDGWKMKCPFPDGLFSGAMRVIAQVISVVFFLGSEKLPLRCSGRVDDVLYLRL